MVDAIGSAGTWFVLGAEGSGAGGQGTILIETLWRNATEILFVSGQINTTIVKPSDGSSFSIITLTANSSQIWINGTHNETIDYGNANDTQCYINDTKWENKTYTDAPSIIASGFNFSFINNTVLANQDYHIGVYCNKTGRINTTDTVSFLFDISTPTITIPSSNFFNSSNSSSTYKGNITINLTFSDDVDLFGYLINVTKGTQTFFNFTNLSIDAPTANYTHILDPTEWANGLYDIEVTFSDGHTNQKIEDYGIEKGLNKMSFDTAEKNKITVSSVGAVSTDYSKSKDRYSFGFNYLLSDTSRTFILESDKQIYYLANSKFNGHFVVWNSQTKSGNWIDFEGIGDDYSVTKVNDKKYEIRFDNLKNGKSLTLNSIGGLNVVTNHYSWYKGNATETHAPIATVESWQTFTLNVTNSTPIRDINASLLYNGTQRTVGKYPSMNSYFFNSSFFVPEAESVYNFTWYVNVTETDNTVGNFTIDGNQSVLLSTLTINVFDEENHTAIVGEDITFYFSLENSITQTTNTGQLIVGNLSVGNYRIEAEGQNYPRRGIYLNVTNQTYTLNFYLCRDLIGNDYIDYYLYNQEEEFIEDATMTFYRRYNNTYVMVAQIITDYAGQARVFQDQQYEYRITMMHPAYQLKTIDLIPLKTTYNVLFEKTSIGEYSNPYYGISFKISPRYRTINMSGGWEVISLELYDSFNSLDYFGVRLANHSFVCDPASCVTNVTGSPSGGTAIVKIWANQTGLFDVQYFFKRSGYEEVFLHGDWYNIEAIRAIFGENIANIIDRMHEGFDFGGNYKILLRSIFASFGIVALLTLAAELGIVGAGMFVVVIIGTAFFSLIGFIHPFVGIITVVVGIIVYMVSTRDE